MRTFIMGDIHGAFIALLQCLQRSGFSYAEDRLIQLGDIVDGYEEAYECVEELLNIPHLIAIRGNHDDWFSEFLRTGFHPQRWEQGGAATLSSYRRRLGKGGKENDSEGLTAEDIPQSHKLFFAAQKPYYIDGQNNCFVHGGFNRLVPFEKQLPHTYCWDRTLWKAAMSFEKMSENKKSFKMVTPFSHIFIGHTCTLLWKTHQPMSAANVYNLDTGAGYSGRLTIMDVDTKEYWQSDPVNTLYEQGGR